MNKRAVKLNVNDLRKIIKEAASGQEAAADVRQAASEMTRILKKLDENLQDVGDDIITSDVFEAIDELYNALRKLATSVEPGGKASSLAGKGVQQGGHWLGSRWVQDDVKPPKYKT